MKKKKHQSLRLPVSMVEYTIFAVFGYPYTTSFDKGVQTSGRPTAISIPGCKPQEREHRALQ